jgi:acyl carrier protein
MAGQFERNSILMLEEVKAIIGRTLQLGERANRLKRDTPLLGNLPELDSMAVVSIITALEEHYGFLVDDEDITADTFATLGSLTDFVEHKIRG